MSYRTYSELAQIPNFVDRWRYLALRGQVGDSTFGHDRWINQMFYRSKEWRDIRSYVIMRDNGCDLGVEGFEIHEMIHIHHMNPMTPEAIAHGDPAILDPEFLITTTQRTHNAIHFGDEKLLPQPFIERKPRDHILW